MSKNSTERELRDWRGSQSHAERLAGHILRFNGYEAVDPSHPLGGPDGLKDALCQKAGKTWIGAFYFPTSSVTAAKVRNKFKGDLKGLAINNAQGIAFVTNQQIQVADRKKLEKLSADEGFEADLIHLERVISTLDSPQAYGVRLTYLDIEMSKEEQIAFVASHQQELQDFRKQIDERFASLEETFRSSKVPPGAAEQIDQLKRAILTFYPDPMSVEFLFPTLFGRRSLSISQLNEFATALERLEFVVPALNKDLSKVIQLVTSLSKGNDLFNFPIGAKSKAEQFEEGKKALASLATIFNKENEEF